MRALPNLFAIGLLATAISAAALQVTGPIGTRTTLKVYEDADGKSELASVSVKDITFPITAFEISDRGFVRVKLDGKQVWLDKGQLRIPPESMEATCITANRADAGVTPGGLRGANSGCK